MKFREVIICMVCLFMISCENLIEVGSPISQIDSETVFKDSLTAKSALIGLYAQLTFVSDGDLGTSYMAGLSSDELDAVTSSQDDNELYINDILPTNSKISGYWQNSYQSIYLANSVISGLQSSENIADPLRDQMIGEAKVIRAFCYMNLINFYGDVPYAGTTDYLVNRALSRTPREEIYESVIGDLIDAKKKLVTDYRYSNGERIRINSWVATALLARAYLYVKDWSNAEVTATEIINYTSLFKLVSDLNAVFLKNSEEAIWQLMPSEYQYYTTDGGILIQPDGFISGIMSENLVNSFEPGDGRRDSWIALGAASGQEWHYPFKYKENSSNASGSEYLMIFRLAEQYLIRAEARAYMDKLNGENSAISDINVIRERAGLDAIEASVKADVLLAIQKERQVELFTEWGHRWVDLKRFGHIDRVLGALKMDWSPKDTLFPIPQSERLTNPNLEQNYGY